MKLSLKRVTMIALLLAGIIWNILCIYRVIPRVHFTLSIIVIAGYSFIISFLPLLLFNEKKNETSKAYSTLSKKEKALSIITIALAIAWIITVIICIIYSF